MKNKLYIIILLLIISLSITFSINTVNELFSETTNNVVAINDILETTSENFNDSFNDALNLAQKYNLDITILDNKE